MWVWSLLVAVAASGVSIGRLWLANPEALTKVLWAEDGLFPLCVSKAGFLACAIDPFAGYSILLPRLLAGVTALFAVSSWPLVVAVMAALLAGLTSGVAFWWLRRYGLGALVAGAVALLPVITPIVGLESINVIASVYMLMLFLTVLMLALPVRDLPTWPVACFFLLTALTIPSMAIVLIILIFQMLVGQIAVRKGAVLFAAGAFGVLVQFIVSQTAEKPRVIQPSVDTLTEWVNAVPTALLTFWPGLALGEQTIFTNYVSAPASATAMFAVAALFIVGVVLTARYTDRLRGVGLLILAGLALGAFPSVIGFVNNRYFVVPCLLWAAALLIGLDPVLRRARWWALGLVVLVTAVIWWPAMPASAWRTTPAPSWPDEVSRIVAQCSSDPGLMERPIFTPFWPPNWGDGLAEPSHPNISCLIARKWN